MAGRWLNIKEMVVTARNRLHTDGIWWVLAASARTGTAFGRAVLYLPNEIAFERHTQTRTRGDSWSPQHVVASAHYGDGNHYKPIDRRLMSQVLRKVDIDPQTSTFIDLGCGKGRALIVAAELGYRHIVGVEYDPQLADCARCNAEAYMNRSRSASVLSIEIIEGDATTYEPPIGAFVLFMYNPFGEKSVGAVIDRFVKSWKLDPRPAAMVYAFPRYEEQLRRPELVETARVGSLRHKIDQAAVWYFR